MNTKDTRRMASARAGLAAAIFCSVFWLTSGIVIVTHAGVA